MICQESFKFLSPQYFSEKDNTAKILPLYKKENGCLIDHCASIYQSGKDKNRGYHKVGLLRPRQTTKLSDLGVTPFK